MTGSTMQLTWSAAAARFFILYEDINQLKILFGCQFTLGHDRPAFRHYESDGKSELTTGVVSNSAMKSIPRVTLTSK
jgi:hypothetical protein